ncbi:MAG: HAD-IC family P-type ATPase, partial [Deltaproteobacteria bacterium]
MKGQVQRDYLVCHSARGRLRVKVRAIRFSEERAHALARFLARQDEVRDAKARSHTGSVILYYDPRVTRPQAILELLNEGLDNIESTTVRSASLDPGPDLGRDREGERSGSAVTRVATAMGLTGFLAYYLVRTIVQRSPVSQALVTLVTIIGGLPLFRRALSDLHGGKIVTLNTFLASASGLAIAAGEPATALEVIWVRAIGEMAEGYVADRSRRAIGEILQLSERNAFVLVDGVEVEIPVEEVRHGDTVVVRAGGKIPVDGAVTRGEALVDEAHITGRKEPERRVPGDGVLAGTVVQQGMVRIEAEKVGHETYLARIGRLVEESLANRAPAEKKADVLAQRLTTVGLAVTGATLVVTRDLAKALAVYLVMACPCATVLAAATAVSAALANAARNRILVKGGLYMERFGATDCICFDKTGTLTTDEPRVAEVVPRPTWIKPETVIELAA